MNDEYSVSSDQKREQSHLQLNQIYTIRLTNHKFILVQTKYPDTAFWTDPGLTPVRAVPVASGLWRGVHLVGAGQEVEALQSLLRVRVLGGVHAGGGQ